MSVPGGTLLFTGDVVTTGNDSGAELTLIPGGAIAGIDAGSEVHLAAAGGDLDLRHGAFTLRSSPGKPAHAHVLGTLLVIGAAAPAICRIEARSRSAVVATDQGTVMIEDSVSPVVLVAGRTAQLKGTPGSVSTSRASALHLPLGVSDIPVGAGQLPAGPASVTLPEELRAAGRVAGSYPDVEVRHPDSPIPVPLRLGEIVDVGDTLGTVGSGRVRVQLLDNTIFDLGIATAVSVLQHDPDRHSTELDLHEGHLHADIGAPSGAQPHFQVRTPIVDVSANPTVLFVSAGPKDAVVCSAGSGPVTVRSPNGAAPVMLAAGQCSVTRAGEAPGPPRSDAARLQYEMELATFEAGPSIPELARSHALKQASTSTSAAAAVLAGIALIEVSQLPTSAKELNLNALTSAFNDLSDSASAAAQAARNLCLAFLKSSLAHVPSPSIPTKACGNAGP